MVGVLAAAALAVSFPTGTAVIQKPGRDVVLRVEVASTDAQRQQGLMFRRRLAPRTGMVFLFGTPVRGGFWMKNTLIPLSIAFTARNGRILRILDMTPCTADPCPIYDPGLEYSRALEVNRGAFRRWGVRVGHVLRLRR
jgi:uncharacterized protein